MPSLLGKIFRSERGAVTIIGAMMMVAMVLSLAFATDLGSIYLESRRLQGIADAAALSAVENLSAPNSAAQGAVDANGWDGQVTMKLETGAYTPSTSVAVPQRFDGSATQSNAARVTLSASAKLFFGVLALGTNRLQIQRSATAARANLASFSIGSRLLSLQGGVANALLSQLTGSNVNLSVMDYQALLNANVDLFSFSRLLQTQLNLKGATFDTVLSTSLSAGQLLGIMATTLDNSGQTGAATSVRTVAAGATGTARLSDLIDLGPFGAQDHLPSNQSINLNAFDLLRSALQLSSGKRQLALNLSSSIPGLLNTTVKVSIGDRMANSPWLTISDDGQPIISTAQTRIYIDTSVLPASGLLLYNIASVRLPLYIELAQAQAKLSALSCSARTGSQSVTLQVLPSPGHASIADLSPTDISDQTQPLTESPAKLVSLPLIAVTGQARVDLSSGAWQTVTFNSAEISAGTVKTVSSSGYVQGITTSLIQKINLQVTIAGLLGLNLSTVTSLVGATLSPAAPVVDSLLDTVLGLLGIHLGQADVRVNGMRCGQAALVG